MSKFDFARIKNSQIKHLAVQRTTQLSNQGDVPESVRYLSIAGTTVENFNFGASNIITLDMRWASAVTGLEGLPGSLTTLDISNADGVTSLAGLPGSLTTLAMSGNKKITALTGLSTAVSTLDMLYTTINSLQSLPAGSQLETLCISWPLQSLKGLPATVKTLTIYHRDGFSTYTHSNFKCAPFDGCSPRNDISIEDKILL